MSKLRYPTEIKQQQYGRILRIRLENCWGAQYELIPRIITISRRKNGEYWSRCSFVDESLKKIVKRIKLDREIVESLLAELYKLKIPVFPRSEMGCDGGFTEIEIGDYEGKACYRWWSEPPPGWKELDRITGLFIDISGI